ncbi:MAG TPA: hypothetical protein VMV92_15430 [Streptosporangiaceae bacterium]|nr:hypothetical protein [Streptosporangiaceae bacterium]
MTEIAVLDAATADLFSLDLRAEPADDLSAVPSSEDCTSNGCTRDCKES